MRPQLAELDELPELRTERLTLRRLSLDDAPALFEAFSDPEVMRFWSTPPHAEVEQTRQMIAHVHAGFETRTVLQWGLERIDDGRLVGTVTLLPATDQPRAEIGYILAREHWGRGFAAEAQRAAIDFAFGPLALHRLEADTHPGNEASARSLERLGFRREGLQRERWLVEGELSDSLLWGLLAGEWNNGAEARG